MISDILWGLTGALDAVVGLFIKIAQWAGSSDSVTDVLRNHGVDRDSLSRDLYGNCASDPHKYFDKLGPALCREDRGITNIQGPLSSDLDPKSAAFGQGNPVTEFVDNSLKHDPELPQKGKDSK